MIEIDIQSRIIGCIITLNRRKLFLIELLCRVEPLNIIELIMHSPLFLRQINSLVKLHSVIALILPDERISLHRRWLTSREIRV